MSQPVLVSEAERAERAAAWAARLTDGRVPPRQEKEFQAWLDADPRNGEALQEIIGAWHAVEHYATSPQMVALREAALATARRSLRRGGRRAPLSRGLTWMLVAASLVLALTGGGLALWLTPRTYETGVGERRVVALSDGSKLSLDGATVVQVAYRPGSRRLWLKQGRAKFEVAKNSLRPFSVEAAGEVVVATGTAFSVELVQKQVRVVLYEGHVALLERRPDGVHRPIPGPDAQGLADTLLTPGREAILPANTVAQPLRAPALVEPADPIRSLSWEGGQLVFEDEKLGVAVERMNRYAETPLVVGDPATANVRISGVFRAGDTDALVQGLAAAFNIRARRGADAITLFKNADPVSRG